MSDTEPAIERRPIKSRETHWAEQVTDLLIAFKATPNSISVAGMFAAILAGFAFGATSVIEDWGSRALWLTGGLLCQVRLLCNLFDGMVAVKRGIASRVGELYNEVPDRVSDVAILVGVGYAVGGHFVLGFGAALAAVFVAYVRAMGKAAGATNDFCGPMAKPQRMAIVTVLAIGMAIVPASWRWELMGEELGLPSVTLAVILVGCLLTASRRLIRAARELAGRPM